MYMINVYNNTWFIKNLSLTSSKFQYIEHNTLDYSDSPLSTGTIVFDQYHHLHYTRLLKIFAKLLI